MIVAPIVVIFLGYTAASYGIVLMKSWDITFRSWVSPLYPYQWPADGSPPPTMPEGQLWPGGALSGGGTGTGTSPGSGGGWTTCLKGIADPCAAVSCLEAHGAGAALPVIEPLRAACWVRRHILHF